MSDFSFEVAKMPEQAQVAEPHTGAAPAPAMTVSVLGEDTMARWDAFVMSTPDATFFHRAGWKTVLEEAFGYRTFFLYAEAKGQILAVLPLAQVRSRLFGHSLCSLPFCVYGGIAGSDPAAVAALDRTAQDLAARMGVGHLEYRSIEARHPERTSKGLYCTFRKQIELDVEKNMLAIPRKQRAMVRKGIAAGLRSIVEDGRPGTARFFDAYSTSVHRLGTPVLSKRYFALLQTVFGHDCEILSVCLGQETVASVLVFYFRDEVLPYYGGGKDAARTLAGNDFMYWEVMRRACERGYTLFDFGRSKQGTGAFDFKKNWGFVPTALQYEYKLYKATALPENHPLNPKYRTVIDAWRKLPLRVANFIGPHIARHLG
jgi:FemAB-related protein (PEP-CTERM system-associated)